MTHSLPHSILDNFLVTYGITTKIVSSTAKEKAANIDSSAPFIDKIIQRGVEGLQKKIEAPWKLPEGLSVSRDLRDSAINKNVGTPAIDAYLASLGVSDKENLTLDRFPFEDRVRQVGLSLLNRVHNYPKSSVGILGLAGLGAAGVLQLRHARLNESELSRLATLAKAVNHQSTPTGKVAPWLLGGLAGAGGLGLGAYIYERNKNNDY